MPGRLAVLATLLTLGLLQAGKAQVVPDALRIPPESEYLLGITTGDLPDRFNASAARLSVSPRITLRNCERGVATSCEFGVQGLKYVSAPTGTDNRTIRRIVVLGTFQQSRELAFQTVAALIDALRPDTGRQDAMQAAVAVVGMIRPATKPFEPVGGRTTIGDLQILASGSQTDWSVTLKPNVTNPADAIETAGMPYDAARRVFLARGWKPAEEHGRCAGDACRRYPEAEECQAGRRCLFQWRDTDWLYRSVAADLEGDRLITRDVAPWPRLDRTKPEW